MEAFAVVERVDNANVHIWLGQFAAFFIYYLSIRDSQSDGIQYGQCVLILGISIVVAQMHVGIVGIRADDCYPLDILRERKDAVVLQKNH